MDLDTTRNINAIGYDWKEYSESFVMVSDRSYYIADQNEQSVYKIIFESFSGQSSGNISFNILETEQLMSAQEYGLSSDEINIYPNPSSGVFFLDLKSSSNINITVKNMAGQTIKTQKLNTSNWIDLSDQVQGFYIIHVTGTNINKVKKVSIVK